MSAPADQKRALHLLEMVSHASANEGEALNAARALGQMKERVGGFEKLFATVQPVGRVTPPVSFNEARRTQGALEEQRDALLLQVAKLEAKVSSLTVRNNTLSDENKNLKDSMRKNLVTKADGSMPYQDFANKARKLVGVHGWQQEFSRQTNVEVQQLRRASVNGIAPPEIVALLATLKNVNRARFTPLHVKTMRRMATTKTDSEIGEAIQTEYPELGIITESVIRKLRVDLRSGNLPYGDDAYGGALPTIIRNVEHLPPRSRVEGGESSPRNEKFPWSRFPELEVLVCENYVSGERKSAIEMAAIVTERSGIAIKDGTIKQRLNSGVPLKVMIDTIDPTGPLTFLELWYLGSRIERRGWMSHAMKALDFPEGDKSRIRSLLGTIPRKKVDALRARVRAIEATEQKA